MFQTAYNQAIETMTSFSNIKPIFSNLPEGIGDSMQDTQVKVIVFFNQQQNTGEYISTEELKKLKKLNENANNFQNFYNSI